MQEELEDELYLDSVNSEDETPAMMPVEDESTEKPPSETPDDGSGETPRETPREIPRETAGEVDGNEGEQPSIVSFFGRSAGVAPSSGFKLNLTIDLGTMDAKRQKISSEWSVCLKSCLKEGEGIEWRGNG